MQASAGETAVRVVLILQNLVLLLFMGGLAWIFRMRGDSPYLMVDEEEGGTSEGDAHLRTELGVLGEVLHATVRTTMHRPRAWCDRVSAVINVVWLVLWQDEANGRDTPHSDDMDAFTLHDIEVCSSRHSKSHRVGYASLWNQVGCDRDAFTLDCGHATLRPQNCRMMSQRCIKGVQQSCHPQQLQCHQLLTRKRRLARPSC
jgi:hypothetical protein